MWTNFFLLLTLFRLGGGLSGTPLAFFRDNSKSIGLELFKLFDFSNEHMHLTLGSKRGFSKYCPAPQAYCLNALFYLTRLNLYLDLFPVIGFWLFIDLWKALNNRKQIAMKLRIMLHRCIYREFTHFQFSLNTYFVIEILFEFALV